MPQTLIQVSGIKDKPDAEKIVEAGEALDSVKLVNVNTDDGRVVVTHSPEFDLDAFKKVINDLGYSA